MNEPATGTITVRVRFIAMLARELKLGAGELVAFELPRGARLRQLLDEMGRRYADRFPPNTWDVTQVRFHPHVSMLQNGEQLRDPATALEDGAEITVLVAMQGGAGDAGTLARI